MSKVGFHHNAFNIPRNTTNSNCDEGSIWANISTKELHVCLDGDRLVFHSGMSEIGPTADPDIISWIKDTLTINGNLTVSGIITGSLRSESSNMIIDGGEIDFTTHYMGILGESGENDDLDIINGGFDGALLTLFPTNSDSDITLKDGTGNLNLNGADKTLKHLGDILILIKKDSTWKLVFTNA